MSSRPELCCLSGAVVVTLVSSASAQLGTATLQWQLSADQGQTWHAGLLEVPRSQTSVLVRSIAQWDQDAGIMFSGVRMDMVWRSDASGGLSDELVDLTYNPRLVGTLNPIGASRFGHDVKIDDLRDTLPPGLGTRGVPVNQPPINFGVPVDLSNPISLFTYRVVLDGTEGDRTATAYFIAPLTPPGNTSDRLMQIYTTPEGANNIPLSALQDCTLRVIPAPAGTLFIAAGAALARRRRRPST